eukprot:923347-Alexandrium_andersonii.AAC.1
MRRLAPRVLCCLCALQGEARLAEEGAEGQEPRQARGRQAGPQRSPPHGLEGGRALALAAEMSTIIFCTSGAGKRVRCAASCTSIGAWWERAAWPARRSAP